MEPLSLHPKLVHLPIALAVLMPLLTGGLLVAWWRDWLPKRTWVLAVAAQALLVASGFFAMRSGDDDEGRAGHFVPESAIEAHEESAESFFWAGAAGLALSLVPLLVRDVKAARLAGLATVAGTAVVLILGYRVGESGGELVYRHGAAAAFTTGAGVPSEPSLHAPQRHHDDDDDD